MKRRRGATVQDAGVIGWISISEVLLLCGVTMLAMALAVGSNLKKTRDELAVSQKAESEVPALRREILDLQEGRHADREEILGLGGRLAGARRDVAVLTEKHLQLGTDLRAMTAERDDLVKARATATAERDDLLRARADLIAGRDRLAADLQEGLAERDRSLAENRELRAERLAAQEKIRQLQEQLARIDESIVMPLKAAKLVVKIRCEALPPGYDLDLYVQDPHDQICSWAQPRTLWQANETGLLILSEDLRNLRGTTEEIFYSLTIEPSDAAHPYLVFCMLRAKTATPPAGPLDVPVHWEVAMAWKGKLEPIGEGTRRIDRAGKVVYANGAYGYPGLVPLAGFRRPSSPNEKPRAWTEKSMPKIFRGWSDGDVAVDASPVVKVRDD